MRSKAKGVISFIVSALTLFCFSGCMLSSGSSEAVGIASIQKTATDGLVDTYTIYYTDGTTSTFEITNGANGADGTDGKDGEDGKDGTNATGEPVSIKNVEKTSADGLVDTYTIYYTDGTTSTFEIVNGSDGQSITATDLYETYKENYGDDLSYAEFLARYLTLELPEETADAATVINDCLQSVAKVYCQFTETDEDSGAPKEAMYTGASVIYRMDDDYTYFLTNYHVVYDENAVDGNISDTIYCYLYGSESEPLKTTSAAGNVSYDYGDYGIACEYIGGAVTYDIAIVRAKTSDVLKINENVKAVTFAEEYYVGQTAIAIGNPNGDGLSVTQGIVSVDNEYISLDIDGTSRSYRSIRIDTALYSGNSGGGLFNGYGELIGIANAGNVTDQNINFAVPIEIVKGVTENIMLHYNDGDDTTNGVYKLTLGITVMGQNSKYVYDTETGYGKITEEVVVSEVSNGILAKMGLEEGDVLKSIVIGNTAYGLDRYFEIGDYILYLTKGISFYFTYERDGTEKTSLIHTVSSFDLASVA